ncbi:MAG: flagellar M-ring protein FliF [Lawsonibacter sp.]|nr:flagellar M-ring protein FliF [Lawsonibacter sp.]MCI9655641.1 flagellar M-ring protein FliF [Lawsonibacter sp.]
MQTKLKGFWEKIKGFFTKLNKKTRILLGACAAVLLILIVAAVVLLNRKEYAVLYGGLTANETSTVLKYLSDNGVTDYQIRGDTILVPKGRETQLQAQMAMSGNMNTGFMYEFYLDNKSLMDTSDERYQMWLAAGQQYLAAIIRQFDGVRDASVVLTPGTERVYVLDPEATPATASVTIELEGTKPLSSGVVTAIRNTVAFGLEGLEVSNVAIHDTTGNNYSDASGFGELAEVSALKLQYEDEINNKVRSQVLNALVPIYGKDNVSVAVNSRVDMDRRVVESTTHTQPEGSVQGGGLIGTDKYFWEVIRGDTEGVGGVVGTQSNSDIPGYPDLENLDPNGDAQYANGNVERDHNLNTTTEQREVLAGTIVDIGVAVTINQNAGNAGSVNLEALRDHVAVISGIGSEDPASRVSVLIAPFAENTPAPSGGFWLSTVDSWVLYAAIGGLALFVVLLIIVLLLARRSKKKKLAKQKALEEEMLAAEAAAEAVAAAAAVVPGPTGGADIMEVNTEKSMELRKMVRQFAQNNPEIAAQMVKTWLKGESDDG